MKRNLLLFFLLCLSGLSYGQTSITTELSYRLKITVFSDYTATQATKVSSLSSTVSGLTTAVNAITANVASISATQATQTAAISGLTNATLTLSNANTATNAAVTSATAINTTQTAAISGLTSNSATQAAQISNLASNSATQATQISGLISNTATMNTLLVSTNAQAYSVVNSTTGTFGSSTTIPIVTLDKYGRVTNATTTTFAAGGGGSSTTAITSTTANATSYTLSFTSNAFNYYEHTTTGNTTFTCAGTSASRGSVIMLAEKIGSGGHTTSFSGVTWPNGSTPSIPTTVNTIITYSILNYNGSCYVTGFTVY